jgi:hypothetical protein
MTQTLSLGEVTADDFLPHVDTAFALKRDDGRESDLTLSNVTQYQHVSKTGRRQFSLIFVGTPGEVLPQHIYPLRHPQMGTLEIFLVPIGRTEAGTEYEAVFA